MPLVKTTATNRLDHLERGHISWKKSHGLCGARQAMHVACAAMINRHRHSRRTLKLSNVLVFLGLCRGRRTGATLWLHDHRHASPAIQNAFVHDRDAVDQKYGACGVG